MLHTAIVTVGVFLNRAHIPLSPPGPWCPVKSCWMWLFSDCLMPHTHQVWLPTPPFHVCSLSLEGHPPPISPLAAGVSNGFWQMERSHSSKPVMEEQWPTWRQSWSAASWSWHRLGEASQSFPPSWLPDQRQARPVFNVTSYLPDNVPAGYTKLIRKLKLPGSGINGHRRLSLHALSCRMAGRELCKLLQNCVFTVSSTIVFSHFV